MSNINNIDIHSLGIEGIAASVQSGMLSMDAAFGIVDARINKRTTSKRPQILRVVQYRNELARALGKQEIAEPVYANKCAPSIDVRAASSVSELADEITKAGVPVADLITALAARLPKAA